MMHYILRSVFTFLLLFPLGLLSQESTTNDFNCFSILIGKEATSDGSVMLAHNEDDSGERVVNWYKVPNQLHDKYNDSIQFKRGYKIPQIERTNAYLWLEIPELEFSDSYINEHGLVIASDACVSREDQPELVDGGIGYWLRRLVIERAKTAREAVEIAGKLIESVGYASSGRSYCIADSQETWMLSVVKGKHWVAQRIPDDHVAIIPNYYTIAEVDLTDTTNYLGSSDLIDYAINRGWYDPDTEGVFNFRKAYSDQANLKNIRNITRHWVSINALSEKQYTIEDAMPFSFVPKKKLSLKDVFAVLRNHYEGTEYDITNNYKTGNPHQQETMSVCSQTNQYGFVAQLRDWMTSEIGDVIWIAPRRPCTQVFVPIYSGILSVPENLAVKECNMALDDHFNEISDFQTYVKDHRYRLFDKNAKEIDKSYGLLIDEKKSNNIELESKLLENQSNFEQKMLKKFQKKPNRARSLLTKYSKKQLGKLIKRID